MKTWYPHISTHLRFNVQYGDEPLLVDFANGFQARPVHCILVAAILQVLIVADVLHHLVMGNEVVVLAVLLILLWRSGCVCENTGSDTGSEKITPPYMHSSARKDCRLCVLRGMG